MRNSKRIILTALAIMMVLSAALFAGGQKEGATPTAGKMTKIVWYYWGTPQADIDLVEAKVNEYIGPKIGVEVDLQCINQGDYDTRMTAIIGAGEEFDICFSTSWTNNYKSKIAQGAYLPLNDLIASDGKDLERIIGKDFLYATSINGKQYTIPANKEKAHNWGILLRDDLVKKYKFDIGKVKTIKDLVPMFETIKEKEPGVYPLGSWGLGDNLFMLLDWDRPAGDKVPVGFPSRKDVGNVVNILKDKRTVDFLKEIRSYYAAGYIRADAASMSDYLSDEQAGIVFATPKSMKPGKDKEYKQQTGHEWVQIELTTPVMSNRESDGSMMAISVTSKNPKKAMQFLNLFNSDPYVNNLINFGVEGKHYLKVKDTIIKEGPDMKKYSPGSSWMFGNQFINYIWDYEDPNKWSAWEKYNASAIPMGNLGFSFDPTALSSEIAMCQNVWDQYLPALSAGSAEDVEGYIAEAIAAFDAAGVPKIQSEMQKQYDAWKASKK